MKSAVKFLSMGLFVVLGCKGDKADTGSPAGAIARICINEFMASNATTHTDEAGNYPDWFELYNPGSDAVDIGGWYLSDDSTEPRKWLIPAGVTVTSRGWVLFFADNDPEEGVYHVDFRLDSLGEDLTLIGPDEAGNPLVDAIEDYPLQTTDASTARMPDCGDTWEIDTSPTPLGANG